MRTAERIIMKIILFQFICLLIAQTVIAMDPGIFEWNKLIRYEGVNKDNYTKIIETFEESSD
ncbi:YpfB family protein [Bacillus massiliglaciei]|uniref:YpfB family protein n=1 Tax=Bacillus massiliglaciei TaxID=1816693 RepID=UPI000DA5ECE6|nr:YpfB family protein [Bacillus massiliglaciei]